jgi:hypothetical protein
MLVLALSAGSASADAKFDKTSVPGDTDVNLVLNASVQSLVGYNKKVVLTIPDGFTPLSCSAPQGFKCAKSTATNPTRTLITWENTSPAPTEFGITPTTQFPFKMHTIIQSGDYKFVVDQTYSDGTSDHWTGNTGSTNPAPVLKVTGLGTTTGSTATTVAPSTDDTTATTTPSFDVPSYDPSTYTTVPFTDATTATTVVDTTSTTIDATTDSTLNDVAISNTGSNDPGGIRGTEKIVLLGLAVLAVGAAAIGSWRSRQA